MEYIVKLKSKPPLKFNKELKIISNNKVVGNLLEVDNLWEILDLLLDYEIEFYLFKTEIILSKL
jgi:hypothetical protein